LLDANKVQYQEVDVAADKAARDEMVKMTGRMAVPVTTIDGQAVVGYDEKAIKEKLGL
jgi:glutaredoxin